MLFQNIKSTASKNINFNHHLFFIPLSHSKSKSTTQRTMLTGPVAEMLARNKYSPLVHMLIQMLTRSRKIAETYQSPPGLMQMASAMKSTGQGVVVLSCSDPRLNPYQILGIDPTLSKSIRSALSRTGSNNLQKLQWYEMRVEGFSMLSELLRFSRRLEIRARS